MFGASQMNTGFLFLPPALVFPLFPSLPLGYPATYRMPPCELEKGALAVRQMQPPPPPPHMHGLVSGARAGF